MDGDNYGEKKRYFFEGKEISKSAYYKRVRRAVKNEISSSSSSSECEEEREAEPSTSSSSLQITTVLPSSSSEHLSQIQLPKDDNSEADLENINSENELVDTNDEADDEADDDDDKDDDDDDEVMDDLEKLRKCIIECNMTRENSSKLVKVLRSINPNVLPYLPIDCRSFTSGNRPFQNTPITPLSPGFFIYFGVQNVLNLSTVPLFNNLEERNIELSINIDGLPTSRSSQKGFWPILGRVENYSVFIIALYYGSDKPTSSNEFMQPFVNELRVLINDGVTLENKKYNIRLKNIICDLPAKTFLLNLAAHNAYYGCTRCSIRGDYQRHRVTYTDVNAPLRNSNSFYDLEDSNFHQGPTILRELPHIDLVKSVVIDPMHAIYLGVVKRFTDTILGKFKGIKGVVNQENRDMISNFLVRSYHFCPSDFARKPRTLKEIRNWKATEWRMWLLYTGPVVLQKYLTSETYNLFILLSYSTRILCNETRHSDDVLNYIQNLLREFIQQSEEIFGKWFVTMNTHLLLHLPTDVKNFGSLESFSAFPYENFLYRLKRMVRSGNKVLEQARNRYEEWLNLEAIKSKVQNYDQPKLTRVYQPIKESLEFQLPTKMEVEFFKELFFKHIHLRSDRFADSFCVIDKSIVRIFHIMRLQNNTISIIGKTFVEVEDFFHYPAASSTVGMYKARTFSPDFRTFHLDGLKSKIFPMQFPNETNVFYLVECLH